MLNLRCKMKMLLCGLEVLLESVGFEMMAEGTIHNWRDGGSEFHQFQQ